jgi:hypothetical protein
MLNKRVKAAECLKYACFSLLVNPKNNMAVSLSTGIYPTHPVLVPPSIQHLQ